MDIFISESSKGVHSVLPGIIGARLISLTFRPSFQNVVVPIRDIYYDVEIPSPSNPNFFRVEGIENAYGVLVANYGKNIVKMIVDIFAKTKAKRIYMGHDLDVSGQFMASLLFHHLIREGIPETAILRVPLTEIGYVGLDERGNICDNTEVVVDMGFGTFYTESQMYAILEAIRNEQYMMNKGDSKTKAGVRKMFAMHHIETKRRDPDYRILKKSDGTNTCTYLTNSAIAERKRAKENERKRRAAQEENKGTMRQA